MNPNSHAHPAALQGYCPVRAPPPRTSGRQYVLMHTVALRSGVWDWQNRCCPQYGCQRSLVSNPSQHSSAQKTGLISKAAAVSTPLPKPGGPLHYPSLSARHYQQEHLGGRQSASVTIPTSKVPRSSHPADVLSLISTLAGNSCSGQANHVLSP